VNVGPWAAFGLPGILMVVATVTFWMGRHTFVHIPPAGWHRFKKDFIEHGWGIMRRLGALYFFGVSMFWALFDQTATAWILQAKQMDRHVFGLDLEPGQLMAVNPFLVLLFIPLFSSVLYPFAGRFVRVTALRKMGTGLYLAVTSFAVCAFVESRIEAGFTPTIWWQVLAYVLLTAAEILVSITALEFAYTQAPNRLKSVVMCLYLVSVAIGNLLPMLVNLFLEKPDGANRLTGVEYYLFFVFAMLGSAILFVLLARRYLPRDFVQEEGPGEDDLEAGVEMH
jgi:POT family proton-dependent oligopeptide transporter